MANKNLPPKGIPMTRLGPEELRQITGGVPSGVKRGFFQALTHANPKAAIFRR